MLAMVEGLMLLFMFVVVCGFAVVFARCCKCVFVVGVVAGGGVLTLLAVVAVVAGVAVADVCVGCC